ncbi:MAG: hypothetical protein EHM41_00855 [Chloroflexi bacterium]|nr:MAG: hypothetical protein EHM41_00855 [Chloroflexota bacterium]
MDNRKEDESKSANTTVAMVEETKQVVWLWGKSYRHWLYWLAPFTESVYATTWKMNSVDGNKFLDNIGDVVNVVLFLKENLIGPNSDDPKLRELVQRLLKIKTLRRIILDCDLHYSSFDIYVDNVRKLPLAELVNITIFEV